MHKIWEMLKKANNNFNKDSKIPTNINIKAIIIRCLLVTIFNLVILKCQCKWWGLNILEVLKWVKECIIVVFRHFPPQIFIRGKMIMLNSIKPKDKELQITMMGVVMMKVKTMKMMRLIPMRLYLTNLPHK